MLYAKECCGNTYLLRLIVGAAGDARGVGGGDAGFAAADSAAEALSHSQYEHRQVVKAVRSFGKDRASGEKV